MRNIFTIIFVLAASFTLTSPAIAETIQGSAKKGSYKAIEKRSDGTSVEVGLSLKMDYKLYTLWGEPVEVFRPYYEVNSVLIHSKSGCQWSIAPRWTPSGMPEISSGIGMCENYIDVSEKLMKEVKLIGLDFELRFSNIPTNRSKSWNIDTISVVRKYAGILGKSGEFGWDVPGSPSWKKVFVEGSGRQDILEGGGAGWIRKRQKKRLK